MRSRVIISLQLHAIDDKDLIDYLGALPRRKRSEFIRAAMRNAIPAKPKLGFAKPVINQPPSTKTYTNSDSGLVYVDDDQLR